MNTVIEMARNAGLKPDGDDWGANVYRKAIERFAALVREEAQDTVQRLSALVRAQQITIDKLEAQRTWVGLDPEEIRKTNHHMVDGAYHYSFKQGAEWAEAKLRSKNERL